MAKKKLFISIPMRGFDNEMVKSRMNLLFDMANKNNEYELIQTFVDEDVPEAEDNQLWYLGRSIQLLGTADLVLFSADWPSANGCWVEHDICRMYNIPFIEEKDL